jgi:hypothetical protein
LSPLLWNMVVDGLLRRLHNAHYQAQGYAKGKFVSTLCDRMQGRTGHITRWEKSHGARLVWPLFFFFLDHLNSWEFPVWAAAIALYSSYLMTVFFFCQHFCYLIEDDGTGEISGSDLG